MTQPRIGTREEWRAMRLELLAKEKQLNNQRDELAEQRRALPWVRLEKDYELTGPGGPRDLRDIFDGRTQLLVYHFMFGTDWDEGCPSCSFWADNFDGVVVHLNHRDVTMVCVSHAPYDKLAAYQKRMGWTFPWYSSADSDFNYDFGVSFTAEQQQNGAEYNFRHETQLGDELPGLSAFAIDDGAVFHTYSTYSRGLDPFNAAYQLLDLAPKGRDEGGFDFSMAWLRRHDAYEDA
ncbi:MAG: DUF899 domain-containing protein [Actinomycetes bacterium]